MKGKQMKQKWLTSVLEKLVSRLSIFRAKVYAFLISLKNLPEYE